MECIGSVCLGVKRGVIQLCSRIVCCGQELPSWKSEHLEIVAPCEGIGDISPCVEGWVVDLGRVAVGTKEAIVITKCRGGPGGQAHHLKGAAVAASTCASCCAAETGGASKANAASIAGVPRCASGTSIYISISLTLCIFK